MKTLSGDSRGSKLFKPDGELFKQSTFSIYLGNCFCDSIGTLLLQSWRIAGNNTTHSVPIAYVYIYIYIYIQLQIYSNILRNIIFSITFQKPRISLIKCFFVRFLEDFP